MEYIFIHGLGQNPDSWNNVIKGLNMKLPNCPNLSALSSSKAVTYSSLYHSFADKCDAVEGTVNLCGLSLGGVLALNYALEHPAKVHSLVLIAAQYRMPKYTLHLQNGLFRLMPKKMFAQTGFSKENMISLCASMTNLDFSDALPSLRCPVLVICGGKDSANLRASKELSERIPSARLEIIPGAGHEVNVEAAEQLTEVLGFFICNT